MPAAPKPKRSERWELVRFLSFLALFAFALRGFVFAPFSIPSASMLPRLMVGDYLVVTKWNYGWSRYSLPFQLPLFEGRIWGSLPARGDVAVFKYPGPFKVDYIKRIVGLPGDMIQVRSGTLFVNGEAAIRTRIADWRPPVSPNSPCRVGEQVRRVGTRCVYPRYRETLARGKSYEVLDQGTSPFDDTAVFVVPEGMLFAMGDNRDDSLDSRAPVSEGGVGFVPVDHLVGKARVTFFSTDGSAALLKPWTWFTAARWNRIGMRH